MRRKAAWLSRILMAWLVLAPDPALARRVLPADGSPVSQCLIGAHAAGALSGIPDGLIERIALAETGRADSDGVWRPWPWSINADGADFVFQTRDEAVAWAANAPARGVKLLDAGCLQVNLQYHPHAFATLSDAFDPWRNALYAARYLRALYESESAGDWSVAVGLYHSHTPELADEYRSRVASLGAGIIQGLPRSTLAARMNALGALRLNLANGGTLRLVLNRQPTAPGHRRKSPCQIARALAPEMAVAPRIAGCSAALARGSYRARPLESARDVN